MPALMPIPPAVGVGLEWALRSFGTSTTRQRRDTCSTAVVTMTVTPKVRAAA
jgi:hypothetical protein